MLTLHKSDSVFSLRHVPSWLMLAFAAGAVNGTMLLACERLVTHVTGTVTKLGTDAAQYDLLLDGLIVLSAFIAGAMTSGMLINGRAHRGKMPWFSLPLLLTATLVAAVGAAGQLGWLGPFGGEVEAPRVLLQLCVLSFAMGLQNAAVATSTGQLVRTTHLTGPATDLGVHVAELITAQGDARKVARRHAALRFGKIAAYGIGAATSVPVALAHGFGALWLAALVILSATLLSFAPSGLRARALAHAEGSPELARLTR